MLNKRQKGQLLYQLNIGIIYLSLYSPVLLLMFYGNFLWFSYHHFLTIDLYTYRLSSRQYTFYIYKLLLSITKLVAIVF